jgi:hypothetical protein
MRRSRWSIQKKIHKQDVLASSYTKIQHLSFHQLLPSTIPVNKLKEQTVCDLTERCS